MFGFIYNVSSLMNRIFCKQYLVYFLRSFVSVILLTAAFSKIYSFDLFISSLKSDKIISEIASLTNEFFYVVIGYIAIVSELCCGGLILIKKIDRWSIFIVLPLIIFFMFWNSYSLIWGNSNTCNCFSKVIEMETYTALFLDILLLLSVASIFKNNNLKNIFREKAAC